MNDSLKNNINEKVLMKNENDDIYDGFLKSKSPMDFLSGYQFQPNQSAGLLK